jgi:hypothetical protein
MNNSTHISRFEDDISDLIIRYARYNLTHDEMIGVFENQIAALQEALDLEGIEPI